MKALVAVKRVLDASAKAQVKADATGVSKVPLADAPQFTGQLVENAAAQVLAVAGDAIANVGAL